VSVGRGIAEEAEVPARRELATGQVWTGTGNGKVHRDVLRKKVQIMKLVRCKNKKNQ